MDIQIQVCAVCNTELHNGPVSDYHGKPLCSGCTAKAADYESRRVTRVERLEHRAEGLHAEATRRIDQAHKMASIIPLGQPMMPDHHSYSRDRNYRNRIENNFRKGFETYEAAKKADRRAQAADDNDAIYTEDPLAILKLEEKIEEAKALHERMKAANKIIRSKISNEDKVTRLAELGISAAVAAELIKGDWLGRIGFADYALRNSNANIRSMERRLAELRTRQKEINEQAASTPVPVSEPLGSPTESLLPFGLQVVRNLEANRLQILFQGKPAANVRDVLKSRGWRWAPSEGAWQRFLNPNSEYALECTIRELQALQS